MDINYQALLPEIILSVAGIVLMLILPFVPPGRQARLGYGAFAGVALALIAVLAQWGQQDLAFFGMVFQDDFANFSKLIFLIATGAVILASIHYLEREEIRRGEFFPLLLFAAVGMCLMASSADLIMTFLGLETLSIATYVLAGYRRRDMKSVESGLKYFILGAFSTAFLLYGIAFLYGATGTTKYLDMAAALEGMDSVPAALSLGLGLVVVGFGFKAALVPFHIWTPDVYEGAPIPVTAHLAVASKAAAFVALLRILYQVLPALSADWQLILWISAVLTMAVGNLAALTQTNIKRLLAYSSIAHAGYLLVGLTAHNAIGAEGVLFYLLAYAFMNLGAFIIVQILGRKNEQYVEISDYAGLGFRRPFLCVSLSVFLVSLAGIPATGGFTGKLFLFSAAIESGMYWLVVLGLLASAVGLYYYLRIIVIMFMHEPAGEPQGLALPFVQRILIAVMVIGTLYLGIFPGPFLKLASQAVVF